MSDKPLEPQRLYRQIAKQIQTLISSGEFAVGSRLPAERDLATQLKVSRPSVREALIALEVEGVIEVRTGSGIYVKSPKRSNKGPVLACRYWSSVSSMTLLAQALAMAM